MPWPILLRCRSPGNTPDDAVLPRLKCTVTVTARRAPFLRAFFRLDANPNPGVDQICRTMAERKEKVAGLLLAAGASRRMGQTKQFLRLGKKTLMEHTLEATLKSDLDCVILVLGHRAGEMRELAGAYSRYGKLKIIENRHYREGISSSIIAGLEVVREEYDHVMIILADMPRLHPHVINRLLRGYLSSGKTLGAIGLSGRRSHPVIFGRAWYGALEELRGDVGARGLFDASMADLCLVDAPPSYDDRDIDTPEDYRAALLDIPTKGSCFSGTGSDTE